MIPVYQTKFKGSDAPKSEQGNCFQACIASILEIPLEEAFDDKLCEEHEWFDNFNEWLEDFNLACILIPVGKSESGKEYAPGTTYLGYHIMRFDSINLAHPDDGHVCVSLDGTVVHNPVPTQGVSDVGEYKGTFLLVPRNPAVKELARCLSSVK